MCTNTHVLQRSAEVRKYLMGTDSFLTQCGSIPRMELGSQA